jgi:triosephosphate isomerase
MRGKLVVGNWKMNGGLAANATLLAALVTGWRLEARPRTGRWPCACRFRTSRRRATSWRLADRVGRQDLSMHGAARIPATCRASMVAEFGGRFVIVGHSERRQQHAKPTRSSRRKAKAALLPG